MSQTSEAHEDKMIENSVTKIHQGKRNEAKSGPESAFGDFSAWASYFCLPLPSLFFYFLLFPSSSSVGLPGILMINA